MSDDIDDKFYERADAHIHLSNDQTQDINNGKVSASMMYATARFNAWLSACGPKSGEELADLKAGILKYYVDEYRKMLGENLDDYIQNFEKYMQSGG